MRKYLAVLVEEIDSELVLVFPELTGMLSSQDQAKRLDMECHSALWE